VHAAVITRRITDAALAVLYGVPLVVGLVLDSVGYHVLGLWVSLAAWAACLTHVLLARRRVDRAAWEATRSAASGWYGGGCGARADHNFEQAVRELLPGRELVASLRHVMIEDELRRRYEFGRSGLEFAALAVTERYVRLLRTRGFQVAAAASFPRARVRAIEFETDDVGAQPRLDRVSLETPDGVLRLSVGANCRQRTTELLAQLGGVAESG
jgi:hypothetical protein